jgi:hypothetical protein
LSDAPPFPFRHQYRLPRLEPQEPLWARALPQEEATKA